MKKMKLLLITLILCFPLNVIAYSSYIIPGGENIGIEVNYEGVLVIGFYEVNGKTLENDIQIGDYIIKVGDEEVNSINDLVTFISKYRVDDSVNMTIKRNDHEKNITFKLAKENDTYKTGLYIKDSIAGIGTLTYIDPTTNIYGALGHTIIESTTNESVEVKSGIIFKSEVSSIDRSTDGNPGTKNAKFYYNEEYGTIEKNTEYGIYGTYSDLLDKNLVEVCENEDIKLGNASIYTVIDGYEVKEYSINITKIDYNSETKNIHFEIIDEELLNETGGIVQGMSGSPIMQDGKIIGAVTHVVVENVSKGYGIFITTMLEEGEE